MDKNSKALLLIVNAGNAKACAMEAIMLAREGDIAGAETKLEESNRAVTTAHQMQTDVLQTSFDSTEGESINMLMAHAQDHMMNAITVCELAGEIVCLHKMMREILMKLG